jgi:glutathione peroxidase
MNKMAAIRRRILQAVYPVLIKAGKTLGLRAGKEVNSKNIIPPVSFYSLHTTANNGSKIPFETFKSKKVLIVNTASDCGYTSQLSELKLLNDLYEEKLVVIGFPANDFKEQEKGSDEEIAKLCVGTFGIKFPIAKKSIVIKKDAQNAIFQWLTNKEKNGWNEKQPEWNFSKYLVNEFGVLTHYFGPGISPVSRDVIKAVEQKLQL